MSKNMLTIQRRNKSQWLAKIQAAHPANIDLSLERIKAVALRARLHQFNCPVITVAGTNGKGSTIATLAAICRAAGLKVAQYTSPHIWQFNERIVFDGQMISDTDLLQSFEAVDALSDGAPLTFFEFTTLAALDYFQRCQPDVILLEVGLGGRLDAVNIVEPDHTIITRIDYDHMDYLGSTIAAIAAEKAGILRAKKPATLVDSLGAKTVLDKARALCSPVCYEGRDYHISAGLEDWSWSGAGAQLSHLPYPPVMLVNAAAAIAASQALPAALRPNVDHVRQALASLTCVGRQQWLERHPDIIVDVAHNPDAMNALRQTLQGYKTTGKTTAVFSMLADKDVSACIAALKPVVDEWLVAPIEDARAATVSQLSDALTSQDIHNWQALPTLKDAYQLGKSRLGAQDRLVVTGSFYTLAQV
jgi:dihydrofolate synthase / folylpolyglutamate synthase